MISNSMTTKSSTGSVDDRDSSLFQPDTLLSEQYLETTRRKTHLEPEKRLMLAILEDAVDCFQKYVTAERPKEKALFQEAEEWFMEKDSDLFFSFENICESLGLDPDYLRKGLMQWQEGQLRPKAKIYHLNPVQGKKNCTPSVSKHSAHKLRELKNGTK
jgi:hypothetical protein